MSPQSKSEVTWHLKTLCTLLSIWTLNGGLLKWDVTAPILHVQFSTDLFADLVERGHSGRKWAAGDPRDGAGYPVICSYNLHPSFHAPQAFRDPTTCQIQTTNSGHIGCSRQLSPWQGQFPSSTKCLPAVHQRRQKKQWQKTDIWHHWCPGAYRGQRR